jgi:Glycosyltransferase family 87
MTRNPRKSSFIHDFTLGIAPLLFGFNLLTSIAFVPVAMRGESDFRQLYAAACMIRTGHSYELYSYDAQKRFQDQMVSPGDRALPFIRPAFQAALFVPLTWFSYRAAYWIFVAINVGLLALCFFLLRPWMQNLGANSRWHPLTVFVSFTPLANALTMGQDSILLLTLFSLALVMLHHRRDSAAGVLAALGSFKFQLTLPVLLLLILWKKWRFAAGFFLTAVTLAAISVWLTGMPQTRLYLRSIFSMSAGILRSAGQFYRLPLRMMPNLHGLVHGLSGGSSHVAILTAILSIVILVWVWISARSATPEHKLMLAIAAAVGLSYYVLLPDLSLLLAPLVLALDRCAGTQSVPHRKVMIVACLALLLAPASMWFFGSYFYLVSLPIFFFLFVMVVASETGIRHAPSQRTSTSISPDKKLVL